MSEVQVNLNLNVTGKDQVEEARVSFEGLNLTTKQAQDIAAADPATRAAMIEGLKQQAQATQEATEAARGMTEAAGAASSGFGGLSEAMLEGVGISASLFAGFGLVTAGIEALREMTIGAVEEFGTFGNSLMRMHDTLGVPLELAAAWKETEGVTGISADRIVNTLAMMDMRVAQGNKQAQKAFDDLNISAHAFAEASIPEKMEMLSDAMQHSGLSAEQFAVAMKELGGRGALGIIEELNPQFLELQNRIKDLSGPMAEEAKAARDWKVETAFLAAEWEHVKRAIGGAIAEMAMGAFGKGDQAGSPMWQFGPGAGLASMLRQPPTPATAREGSAFFVGPPSSANVKGGMESIDFDDQEHAAARAKAAKEGLKDINEVLRASSQRLSDQLKFETAEHTAQAALDKQLQAASAALAATDAGEVSALDLKIQKLESEAAAKTQAALGTKTYNDAQMLEASTTTILIDLNRQQSEEQARVKQDVADTTAAMKDSQQAQMDAAEGALKLDEAQAKLHNTLENQKQVIQDKLLIDELNTQKQVEEGKITLEEADAYIKLAEAKAKAAGVSVADAAAVKDLGAITDAVKALSGALTAMGMSATVGFGGLVSSIASGLQAGQQAAARIKSAGGLGTDAGKVEAVAAGIDVFTNAMGSGVVESKGEAIGKGMASGAATGFAVAGPWGAAVGAVVGLIGGLFHHNPSWVKVGEDAGKELGMAISDKLAQQIEQDAKKLNISNQAAGLLNLDKALQENGKSALDAGADMGKLMSAVSDGSIPAVQGLQEVDKVFGQMTQDATASGDTMNATLTQTIEKARELGGALYTPAMKAWVDTGIKDAIAGLNELIGTMSTVTTATGKKGKGSSTTTSVTGGLGLGDDSASIAANGKDQASIFMATFQATLSEQGVVAAVTALDPAFNALMQKMKETGDKAGLAAVQAIMGPFGQLHALMGDKVFAGAATAADGLTKVMGGLGQAAYLDKSTFDSLQSQAMNTFTTMTAHGATSKQAIEVLSPEIQKAIQASKDFGIPLDANTQKLIAIANQNGITFKTDPMQQMVKVLTDIDHLMGGKFQDDMTKAGQTMQQTFQQGAQVSATTGQQVSSQWNTTTQTIESAFQTKLLPSAHVTFKAVADFAHDQAVAVSNVWGGQVDAIAVKIANAQPAVDAAFTAVGDAATGSNSGLMRIQSVVDNISHGLAGWPGLAGAAGQAFQNMPSPGGPGPGNSRHPIPHMATGPGDAWLVSQPTIALVGEAGPEMVVPAGSGSTPTLVRGGGGAGTVQVVLGYHVVVHGAGDPRTTAQLIEQQEPHLMVRLKEVVTQVINGRSNT
jgi:hypothetical protein